MSWPRGRPITADPGVPSFDAFYAEQLRPVVALAYALSGSRLAAEDLAQEAFTAAYRRWGEVSGYDSPAAWVRRVVANQSVSLIRRRVSEARALTRLGGQRSLLPELSPDDRHVWQEVRRLPRRQAQSVALYYLADRSLEFGSGSGTSDYLTMTGPTGSDHDVIATIKVPRRTGECEVLGVAIYGQAPPGSGTRCPRSGAARRTRRR